MFLWNKKIGKRYLALMILFQFILPVPSTAEEVEKKTVVAVFPLINKEETAWYRIISSTVTDTVTLTLKMIEKYLVLEENTPPAITRRFLSSYADYKEVDNIVFGEVFENKEGSPVIRMSVYERLSDSVIITEEGKAESMLDIFNVSDEILISFIEKFSGRHVEFGKIVFRNTGTEGRYVIMIDGEEAGVNRKEISRVLTGLRTVVVGQARPLGNRILFEGKISVRPDRTSEVVFAVPYLTPEEIETFDRIDSVIWENWYRRDGEEKIKEALQRRKDLPKRPV